MVDWNRARLVAGLLGAVVVAVCLIVFGSNAWLPILVWAMASALAVGFYIARRRFGFWGSFVFACAGGLFMGFNALSDFNSRPRTGSNDGAHVVMMFLLLPVVSVLSHFTDLLGKPRSGGTNPPMS